MVWLKSLRDERPPRIPMVPLCSLSAGQNMRGTVRTSDNYEIKFESHQKGTSQ